VLPALDEELLADLSARFIALKLEESQAGGPDWALVLAAHGTLVAPPRPMETGREPPSACAPRSAAGWAIASAACSAAGSTTRAAAAGPSRRWRRRSIASPTPGFRNVLYFPYGFLADNAESELEGRVFLRAHPWRSVVHLPCLNAEPELLSALARHVLAGRFTETPALAGA
jgi:hypothetical protein